MQELSLRFGRFIFLVVVSPSFACLFHIVGVDLSLSIAISRKVLEMMYLEGLIRSSTFMNLLLYA